MLKKKLFLAILLLPLSFSISSCGFIPIKGESGAKGEKGEQGENGKDGINGKDGSSILLGEGSPDDFLGNDGDCYINLLNFDFYVKEDGNWILSGNLKGEKGSSGRDGEDGYNGKDGQSLLTGYGSPTSSLGNNGDSYIDLSTFDFYVKSNGVWQKVANIKGNNESIRFRINY